MGFRATEKDISVKRIMQLQAELLKIIEDTKVGLITDVEAMHKTAVLNKELDGE